MRTAPPTLDREPRVQRRGVLKRVLLGRAISTAKYEHHLLPKILALPVFSSDPLSSVAYATEEMMAVLALAGAGAFALMMPLAGVIVLVLAIVVTSYRQTVRAYPRGGGSYIVARENLGTVPGLVAAAAILIGYVVTAAVSVTAGAIAVSSAAPGLAEQRVPVALVFIVVIALANLRGVRESGTLFAVPTYGFVVLVYVTIASGLVRCLGGCPRAETADLPLEAGAGLSLFLILRAATQGASALTGVEAIADGVQAFRRPQGRNAAATLGILGVMSASLFIGVTALARLLGVRVTEETVGSASVLSQIGETVFGRGILFFVLQIFTALILIVAANTAYQDFPRLSAILAGDRFVPSQFRNRGDRLVFSNGVIVLSLLAALLVWAFDASLTSLIPLYLVGVFTAFTLSQAGMVRRWVSRKEPRWVRNAVINAIGATTTGIVLVVAILTRFREGAWMVVAAIPVIVLLFLGVKRHYDAVARELNRGTLRFGETGRNHVVFVMTGFGAATAEALGYIRSLRPASLEPLYVGRGPLEDAQARWSELAGDAVPLVVPGPGDPVDAVIHFVRGIPRAPEDFITVVIPELFRKRSLISALMMPVTFRLKVRLLREPQVVITDVPVLQEIVDAPFRDLGPPLLNEVRRVTADAGTVAAVVIPEFLVTRWWHRLLHNNRALFIKRQLLFEPRVILSSVPYQLRRSDGSR